LSATSAFITGPGGERVQLGGVTIGQRTREVNRRDGTGRLKTYEWGSPRFELKKKKCGGLKKKGTHSQ